MEELQGLKDRLDAFLGSLNITNPDLDINEFISKHQGSDMIDMLPVHHQKVIGLIILACLCGVASIILFVTVCRDRCIRKQKMGFLLINMAVAVILFNLTGVLPRIEAEITHMTSIGKLGCNLVYQLYHTSALEFAIVLVLLGRDSAIFTYKPRSHSNIGSFVKYTILSWVLSYICVIIGFELIGNGFVFISHDGSSDKGACVLKPFQYDMMTFFVYEFAIMYIVPAVVAAVLTGFLIYLSYFRNLESSYKINHMPFVLSGFIFVFFSLPYYITFFYYQNSDVSIFNTFRSVMMFIFSFLKDIAKPIICIIWTVTVPELQRTFLCKTKEQNNHSDEEGITLIDKD